MSVIVWDGKMLAADRRACHGNLIRTTTKIFKINNHLYGYAGVAATGEELLAWHVAGADPNSFPLSQRDPETSCSPLVITPDKRVLTYESSPYPLTFHDTHFAIGSGRDFALAALLLGYPADEAVATACHFDSGCGNGVDVLFLD